MGTGQYCSITVRCIACKPAYTSLHFFSVLLTTNFLRKVQLDYYFLYLGNPTGFVPFLFFRTFLIKFGETIVFKPASSRKVAWIISLHE